MGKAQSNSKNALLCDGFYSITLQLMDEKGLDILRKIALNKTIIEKALILSNNHTNLSSCTLRKILISNIEVYPYPPGGERPSPSPREAILVVLTASSPR
jgi:hypothetical protein